MIRRLLAEFWADLVVQRTRALLTLFAVFWGALTIVLLLAFGEGLKRAVVEATLGAGSRMFMVYGGETTEPFGGLPGGRNITLREPDLDLLMESIPRIDRGSVSYGGYGTLLESDARTTTTMMEGVHPDFAELRSMYPVDGLPFTVIGTMASKAQSGMNNGPDADRAIIPASTFRTIYGPTRVSHLLVRPRDVREAALAKRRIYEVLDSRYEFDPDDTRALGFWDFVEDEKITRAIGIGIQIFLGVVGALTLVVAAVASLPDGNEAMYYIANPTLSWPITLGTVSILIAIGILAGVFPARRAASLDPVESLRYE